MGEVTAYGADQHGARAVGVDLGDGVRLLVQPSTSAENARALEVAQRAEHSEATVEDLRAEVARLRGDAVRARARISELERVNLAATMGQRRFFGPVLLRPANDGAWTGEVWLLDPVKLERGQGLRFASVAEVRTLHPELWPIGAQDGGILLDAWGS